MCETTLETQKSNVYDRICKILGVRVIVKLVCEVLVSYYRMWCDMFIVRVLELDRLRRGANLEEAEIVVGCRWLTHGARGVEEARCAGPQSPPKKPLLSQIFALSK